jgi:hypothetical protein
MSPRQDEIRAAGGKKTGNSGALNGGNGRHPATGLLSWYFAPRRVTGLGYMLTINGYVLL